MTRNKFRILNRPDYCLPCSLNKVATGFSDPEGYGTNGVLALGESLGYNEAIDGLPFRPYAQAGNVLEKAFKKAGFDRKQFGIANIVQCHPPSDSLDGWDSAIEHCRGHLRRIVERYQPKIILALGAVPLRSLTKLAGHKLNLESVRGYPLWCEEFDVYVIATYHPSFIARGAWNVFDVLVHDIKKAVRWARDGVPTQTFTSIEDGTELHMERMCQELEDCPDLPFCFDIEDDSLIRKANKITGPPEITQINVATSEKVGLVVAPTQENMAWFSYMCSLPNMKIGQNLLLYDIPELEDNYRFQVNGLVDDVMWRFHHLYPDLPMKRKKDSDELAGTETDTSELTSIAPLQYIASFADFPLIWKHHSTERPGFYGCCDVVAPMMAYWWLRETMEALGVEDGYQTLNIEFNDTLKQMRRRGIPVSALILQALHEYLSAVVIEEQGRIQGFVPDVVRPVAPSKGYKLTPKDTTGMVQRIFNVKGNPSVRCKCFRVRKLRKTDQLGFVFMSFTESPYAQWTEKADGTRVLRAPEADCHVCGGVGAYSVEAHTETRWARLLPFNVQSSSQMWNYARFKKYRVPMNAHKEFAMDQETISRLAKSTGDPLYVTCERIRRYDKLDSTYAVGWLNEIKADGCVHPQIGDFTSIKQLGSRAPNSQNVPSEAKNPELAPMFRKGIEAPDGRVAYECVTPDTRVLTWDLRWVPAGELKEGDSLIGFDEYATPSKRKSDGGKRDGRKFRHSMVVNHGFIMKDCVRVITDCGSFTCSKDHSLVTTHCGKQQKHKNRGWINASNLVAGMRLSFTTTPWDIRRDYESAYIAGFMDGEGFVGDSGSVGFGQNDGAVAEYVSSTIEDHGYTAQPSDHLSGGPTCHTYPIQSEHAFTGMRFIGQYRPIRLLTNFQKNIEGRAVWGKRSRSAKVICVVPVGRRKVVSMETTTHTLITEGFLSHNCDFKGFHNQTLGYEAAACMNVTTLSPFLRLAKLDIHTYFASQLLKIPGFDKCLTWPDDELLTWLKWNRKEYVLKNGMSLDAFRNAKAKHALHGYGNGLKGPGLFRRYPDNFENQREAEWTVDMLDKTFPEVAQFHEWAPLAANRGVRISGNGTQFIKTPDGQEVTNCVITRYECIRWFHNIKKYDFKAKLVKHGEDWERAMCYPHTNDAHCHIRLVMMRLEALGANERFWCANQVHDALWFFPLKKDLEECHHVVSTEMARASEVMLMPWDGGKGLSVEVDAKYGPNFAEMVKI